MSDSFNLEHLRKEAKSLLKLCRGGDASAVARVRAQLPRVTSEQIKLADIHHALAREHGYRNWAELKRQDGPLSRFLTAVRSGDFKATRTELRTDPDLAGESIHAACVVGDVGAVAYHLDLDPESILSEESGWPPLLYGCASPFHKLSPRHAAGIVECVKLLLDRGMDPNTYTLVDPSDPNSRFYAIMRSSSAVSRLLLERGASPVEFNRTPASVREEMRRMFPRTPLDEALETLSRNDSEFRDEIVRRLQPFREFHGRATGKRQDFAKSWFMDPALRDAAKDVAEFVRSKGVSPNVQTARGGNTILHELVALGNSDVAAEAAEWLLAHGADPNLPRDDGKTPYRLAVRVGNTAVAEIMRKHTPINALQPIDELICAISVRDERAAMRIVAAHPEVLKRMKSEDHETLIEAVANDRVEEVRFMSRVGFNLARPGESGAAALHLAAWNGHVEMVRVLLEFQAPVNIHDLIYGTSPLAWAAHGSRHSHSGDEDYCSIVEMLVAAGATRSDAINAWGIAAEDIASDRVAQLLKRLARS